MSIKIVLSIDFELFSDAFALPKFNQEWAYGEQGITERQTSHKQPGQGFKYAGKGVKQMSNSCRKRPNGRKRTFNRAKQPNNALKQSMGVTPLMIACSPGKVT